MTITLRKRVGELPISRRSMELSSRDYFYAQNYQMIIKSIYLYLSNNTYLSLTKKKILKVIESFLLFKYLKLVTIPQELLWCPLPNIEKRNITIDNLPDEIIRDNFRFHSKYN